MTKSHCPCGSGKKYSECCYPFHASSAKADSPQALMASRYTAYAVNNYQYIFDTYSESFRQDISADLLEQSDQGVEWLSLNILSFETNSNRGKVEFVAIYRQQQEFYRLQENSDFVKQDGAWLYTTGKIHPDSGIFFPRRNDPCPCGSGKKFKKCCL